MPRTTTTVSGMLTTQNQGGGSKKAGLVPTETASVAQALAYAERSAKQPLTFKMKELYPGQPKCMSRPTGLRPMWLPTPGRQSSRRERETERRPHTDG